MRDNKNIQLFEDKKIRTAWDEKQEKWFFSVVDICAVLTDSDYQTARNYWKWLKTKLQDEGSELVRNTNRLGDKETAFSTLLECTFVYTG